VAGHPIECRCLSMSDPDFAIRLLHFFHTGQSRKDRYFSKL
jgi:hypothetical protein